MKKKALSVMLTAAMAATMLAGCGGSSSSSTAASSAASSAAAESSASSAAEEEVAAESTAAETEASGEGKVYYLNFKPEADEALQAIAKTYTEETGVPVKVITAASGKYDDTITSEMDKTDAPTIFNMGNSGSVDSWGEYALPLDDTDLIKEQTTDVYNQKNEDGDTVSVGYCYESYGIITNKALLEKAGYSVDDIKNFDDLKKVADDIHARASELGFDAFTSAGLEGSSSWRFSGHLANEVLYYQLRDDNVTEKPATITDKYLDNFKNIWDLYTTDSATTGADLLQATGNQAESEFKTGQAVFYQNGTWEYSNLTTDNEADADNGLEAMTAMNPDDLTMIPIYCGVEGEEKAGLASGTENCWAVNADAPEEDQQASLDFLKWLVTSDEGTTMMAEQFGACPFKSAKEPENVFFKAAQDYDKAGNYTVTWNAMNWTPSTDDWRAGVVDALGQYTSGTGDWDAVVSAFVDGWATLYANENA